MSDPDDPSSNRFTHERHSPSEWVKSTAQLGSAAATTSRSSSNLGGKEIVDKEPGKGDSIAGSSYGGHQHLHPDGPEPEPDRQPDRRGRRERFKRTFKRHKKAARSDHAVVSEKTASASGAQDTSPPPGDEAALDRGDGDGGGSQNAVVRIALIVKEILFHSYVNLLLVFVPIGIAVHFAGLGDEIVFAMNAIAIIPLAGLLAYATEVVALSLGDTLGALLNVSFGNAVELIIFIIALVKNEINIVQASLIGSILSNLLLILGMAFLFGGLRFQEQLYNSTVTQMSACLLSLSVVSLLLPTAFHASFSDTNLADNAVLKLSRGTSVILLLVYILYLLFQLKSHAYMYESTPQHVIDEEMRPGVLTEFLNTSSSSSSEGDDSSSSSSSDSDESHHTAKVIKRALRGHRRRKSSGSANGTAASKLSRNDSIATTNHHNERPTLFGFKRGSASGSTDSNALASGDEADTDGEHDRKARQTRSSDNVRHRDFAAGSGSVNDPSEQAPTLNTGPGITFDEAHEPKPPRKISKKARKEKRRLDKKRAKESKEQAKYRAEGEDRMPADFEYPTVEEIKPGPAPQLASIRAEAMARHQSSPISNFRQEAAFADAPEMTRSYTPTSGRRPLVPLHSYHLRRPQMQKMLSQTVFSREYNAQALSRPSAVPAVPRAPYGLRRTNSLPNMERGNSLVRKQSVPQVDPIHGGEMQAAAESAEKETDLKHRMSRTGAVVLLLISTALVAVCAEFLVDSISGLIKEGTVTEAFIGLIILPIVGNAAEHVTAVTVAAKNKMDLSIGIAVGSSIQIAIFVTPIVVLLGWILDKGMSLYFTLFETVSLFASAFIVNFLVLDGRSNYLEGALLVAAYTIIAVAAFFYPDCDASSGARCSGGDIIGIGH